MNQCPACGTQYEGDRCPHCATNTPPPQQLLCPRCGVSYTGTYCPNGCNSPIAQYPYQQSAPQPPYAVPEPPKKKKHTGLFIFLTLVIILVFAAGGIFLYFQLTSTKPLEEFTAEGKNFLVTSEQFRQDYNQINGNEVIPKFASTDKDGDRYYVAQLTEQVTLVLLCDPETDYIQMINLQADWGADGNTYGSYIGSAMRLCDGEMTQQDAQALLSEELEIAQPMIGEGKKAVHDGIAYTLNASVNSLSFSILPEAGLESSEG